MSGLIVVVIIRIQVCWLLSITKTFCAQECGSSVLAGSWHKNESYFLNMRTA